MKLSIVEARLLREINENLLSAPAAGRKVVKLPAQIEDRYRRLVASLEAELTRDVHKARTAPQQIIGSEIRALPHESGKHLLARIGLDLEELCEVAGCTTA